MGRGVIHNMRMVWVLTQNQLHRLWSDRAGLLLWLAVPIGITFILGVSLQNAFSPDFTPEKPVRVALVTGDSEMGIAFSERLHRQIHVLEVTDIDDPAAARARLMRREFDVLVALPKGFPKETITLVGEPGTVSVGVASEVVRAIAATFANPAAQAVPVVAKEIGLDPPETADAVTAAVGGYPAGGTPAAPASSFHYYAIGMGVFMLLFAANQGGIFFAQDHKSRVYFRIRAAGLSHMTYSVGWYLGTFALTASYFAVLTAVSYLLFGVGWGDAVSWLGVTAAGSLAATSLVYVLKSLMTNPEQLDGVGNVLFPLMGFLGGSMMPVYMFSPSLTRISLWMPNRTMLNSFLTLSAGGVWSDVAGNVSRLLGTAAVLFVIAAAIETFIARRKGEMVA